MKRGTWKHLFYLFALLMLVVIPTAFSSWVYFEGDKTISLAPTVLDPVCYIDSNTSSNQYTSIERALSKASSGSTVYVYPETNPTIKYDCTISSGVTLTLGSLTKGGSYLKDENDNYLYKDRGIVDESTQSSYENSVENRGPHVTGSSSFADSTDNNIATYRKNSVLLLAKLTIASGGRLNIGGRLNQEYPGLSGATTGDYCEIVVDAKKGSIVNSGTIDCCGYIKTNSLTSNASLVNKNGGVIYEPFVITDFNGGTYSVACNQKDNTKKVMPFNQWVLCNIQIKQEFEYNSKVYGYYDAYNSTYISKSALGITVTIHKGHKQGEISVVGTQNSIINIKSGGKLIATISTSDYLKTFVNNSTIVNKKYTMGFYGNTEIQEMVIPNPMPGLEFAQRLTNVEIADAYSSNYFFSMNHHYDANIYGTLDVTTKQKVLPGCTVTVMPNATLNINADVIFLENLNDVSNAAGVPGFKGYKYPEKFNQSANTSEIRNALINNGTVNVNGASFGGKVYSSTASAVLNLSSSNGLSVTDKEGASGKQGEGNLLEQVKFYITYQPDYVENARGPLITDDTISVSDFAKNVYASKEIFGDYGWGLATDLDSYTITYHLNGGTSSVADGTMGTYYMTKGASLIIKSAPVSDPQKQYYEFAGWYTDPALTTPLSNGLSVSNGSAVNLYAKYVAEEYSITYYVTNDTGITATYTDPNNNSNYLTSFTKTILDNNGGSITIPDLEFSETSSLEFDGWYLANDFSVDTKLLNNQITEARDHILYARFVKIRPKITFEGFNINGQSTFSVEEDGKLSSTIISSIDKELDSIRKNVDRATYINGFSLNGTEVDLETKVFDTSVTLTPIIVNKKSITFNAGTLSYKKYYTRDINTNSVEGSPILTDSEILTINSDDKQQIYKWTYSDNTEYGTPADFVKAMNSSYTSYSDFVLNVHWMYKMSFVCESCGEKNPVVKYTGSDGKEIQKTITTSDNNSYVYVVGGTTLSIHIDSHSLVKAGTKITSNISNLNGSNGWLSSYDKPIPSVSSYIEITITSA